MPAESQAEKMLMKLLLHNRLITKNQLKRIIDKSVGLSNKTLHEEIVDKRFVDPVMMKKIVSAILSKGLIFPILNEDLNTKTEELSVEKKRAKPIVASEGKTPIKSPNDSAKISSVSSKHPVDQTKVASGDIRSLSGKHKQIVKKARPVSGKQRHLSGKQKAQSSPSRLTKES